MGPIRALAFAKINLLLAVGARRPDGYHELDTVLQTIDLADEIELASRPDGPIVLETRGEHPVPADRSNLCFRAAEAARDAWAPGRGLQVGLTKRVPVGAGLGGGSSDAAAVLTAVQVLWQVAPSAQEQQDVAAGLGSDVPFFLTGGTAAASGRGERIEPLPPAPPIWFVLAKPDQSISTAWAYERFDALGPAGRAASQPMRAALASGDLGAVAAALHNDLEAAVLPAAPQAARLKRDLLARGCLGALMAGSGSAVFGITPSAEAAQAVARELESHYPWVRVARTCSQGSTILPRPRGPGQAHA